MPHRATPNLAHPPDASPFSKPELGIDHPGGEEAPKSRIRRLIPARGTSLLFDFLILGAALAVLNWVIAPHDPGWTTLNPSPYIIMPVLLGARYGLLAGLLGGLFGPVYSLAGTVLQGAGPETFAREHVFYLFSLPVTGLLAGVIGQFFAGKLDRLSSDYGDLVTRHARLEADQLLIAEANHDLKRRLALQGSEFCTLDTELRRLFAVHREHFLDGFLNLLRRTVRVTDASVYSLKRDRNTIQLHRLAHIGDPKFADTVLPLESCAMASLALRQKHLVTCKEFWDRLPDSPEDHLAAYPWFNLEGQPLGVLLVHRMDFLSITTQNLARLEVLCRWVSTLGNLNEFSSGSALRLVRLAPSDHFREAIDIAGEAWTSHAVVSTALVVRTEFVPPSQSDGLETALLACLPGCATITRSPTFPDTWIIVLPGEGASDAHLVGEEVRNTLRRAAPGSPPAEIRLVPVDQWDRLEVFFREDTA